MLKKRTCLFLLSLILIIGALPVSAFANDMEKNLNVVAENLKESLEEPDARITINQELGLIIVSTGEVYDKSNVPYHEEIDLVDVDFQDNAGPDSYPQKPTSATFSHKIYDRNGILMATAYVTVKGVYSEAEQWSEITDITAKFEGDFAHDFSYDSNISGDTGTIYIYFNELGLGSFRYKIYYNGRIANI